MLIINYTRRVYMGRSFAKWYDFFMNPLEKRKFASIRKNLLQHATGKVLEIGAGTGINFPFYHQADSIVAIEPNPYMIEKSNSRMINASVPIEVVRVGAEQLPFNDHSFDCIVATLVFCTIPNVEQAINEMKRVCKPGGRILFFEHVKMNHRILAGLQDFLTPVWKKICDGCCLNRETDKLIVKHGLKIVRQESYYGGLFLSIEAIHSTTNS
jgi:ubiquinone/menaquinone biosynthesis C-methylase UbiE